eukprot:scaffold15526_cov60-Phaeocystis_antarctica.AAC.3
MRTSCATTSSRRFSSAQPRRTALAASSCPMPCTPCAARPSAARTAAACSPSRARVCAMCTVSGCSSALTARLASKSGREDASVREGCPTRTALTPSRSSAESISSAAALESEVASSGPTLPLRLRAASASSKQAAAVLPVPGGPCMAESDARKAAHTASLCEGLSRASVPRSNSPSSASPTHGRSCAACGCRRPMCPSSMTSLRTTPAPAHSAPQSSASAAAVRLYAVRLATRSMRHAPSPCMSTAWACASLTATAMVSAESSTNSPLSAWPPLSCRAMTTASPTWNSCRRAAAVGRSNGRWRGGAARSGRGPPALTCRGTSSRAAQSRSSPPRPTQGRSACASGRGTAVRSAARRPRPRRSACPRRGSRVPWFEACVAYVGCGAAARRGATEEALGPRTRALAAGGAPWPRSCALAGGAARCFGRRREERVSVRRQVLVCHMRARGGAVLGCDARLCGSSTATRARPAARSGKDGPADQAKCSETS